MLDLPSWDFLHFHWLSLFKTLHLLLTEKLVFLTRISATCTPHRFALTSV